MPCSRSRIERGAGQDDRQHRDVVDDAHDAREPGGADVRVEARRGPRARPAAAARSVRLHEVRRSRGRRSPAGSRRRCRPASSAVASTLSWIAGRRPASTSRSKSGGMSRTKVSAPVSISRSTSVGRDLDRRLEVGRQEGVGDPRARAASGPRRRWRSRRCAAPASALRLGVDREREGVDDQAEQHGSCARLRSSFMPSQKMLARRAASASRAPACSAGARLSAGQDRDEGGERQEARAAGRRSPAPW